MRASGPRPREVLPGGRYDPFVPRFDRLLWVMVLLLAGSAAPAAAGPLRLRVVTFNVWGLPWGIAAHREARLERIGPALAALRPDVVALQEVWVEADGERLRRVLADAGLVHSLHLSDGFLGSGLLVASRHPLGAERFTRYEAAGKPHKPFHGDWFARKGVVVVRLDTPAGPVLLADTHLHARYGTDEYLPVQVAQALQLIEAVGDFGRRPPEVTGDAARPPLVLAGDLNARWGSLPLRLTLAGAALRPVDEGLGIDWLLVRDGGALEVRVRRVEAGLLTEDVDLGEGVRAPLSDHPAVLAELELRPRRPVRGAPSPRGDPAWPAVAAEARDLLEAARDERDRGGRRGRLRAGALLLVAGAAFAVGRRRRKARRGGWLLMLLALGLLHLAVWALYLGVVYEPGLQQGLEAALGRLDE